MNKKIAAYIRRIFICCILFNSQLVTSTRQFRNENLRKRTTYFLWLLLIVAGLVGFQLLLPFIKPHRYSGSITEWLFTFGIIIIVIVAFMRHRRLVSITFDDLNKRINLTTTTLFYGDKTDNYQYSDIIFKRGQDPARFRKKATEFIEIYGNRQRIIKLEKTTIGEYVFDNIVKEFQDLKNHD